jgi:ribonuclease BN (tRNA processing enzyme)
MATPVQVTVLGSGDAFGSGGRLHSGYLVESAAATFLVDCGPSVLQGLRRCGVDPARIDFVCVSHLHGDHFGGLPFLFMDAMYVTQRTRLLPIYGPPDTERRVRALFRALYEQQADAPPPFPISYTELEPAPRTLVTGIDLEAFVVPHVRELVCYGFRFDIDGRAIVYSGDTGWTDDFVARTHDVDVFICECSSFETEIPIHVAYPQIAARAAALGCRRLVLSHLGQEVLDRRDEVSLELAEDGMVIRLDGSRRA